MDQEPGNRGTAVNLLEKPFPDTAVNTLRQQNLSQKTWQSLASILNVPEATSIKTIDTYLEAVTKLQKNQVSGLTFERSARPSILPVIVSDVLYGKSDFAVLETDMNDLKGLNDLYGDKGADPAIRRYADWLMETLTEEINNQGSEIKYAIVNISGEGSDSMKIFLFGRDIYKFCRQYTEKMMVSSTSIELQGKNNKRVVSINGGWGFYVFLNEDTRKINDVVNGELVPLNKAGEIYNGASLLASDRMSADKNRKEAELINKIFDAQTTSELEILEEAILGFGERVPAIINRYYFAKKKQFSTEK